MRKQSNALRSEDRQAPRKRAASGNRRPPFTSSRVFKGSLAILANLAKQGSKVAEEVLQKVKVYNFHAALLVPQPVPGYGDPECFARDYLAWNLLRKSLHLPIVVDRREAALQKWRAAEDSCAHINRNHGTRPYGFDRLCGAQGIAQSFDSALSLAKKEISNLLGTFSWDECSKYFGYSGGASTRLPRRVGHPVHKYGSSLKPHVTRNCALLALTAIHHSPVWRTRMEAEFGLDPFDWIEIVPGSRFDTVDKTALTDRIIAIEPDLNMYLQRGIGAVLRKRLKHRGIDLNRQDLNATLARIGSQTGSLVTIDLASASDSVAIELCRLLLPTDWFDALMLTRCEYTVLPDGKLHRLEKISSMGNGFTFELESLIFWALAVASVKLLHCEDQRIGIYGDDIVVHNSVAEYLIGLLSYTGFETNVQKTFISGPFRESCGSHWFLGADVTPFNVKEQYSAVHDMYWLVNSFRIWASSRPDPTVYQGTYSYLCSLIPEKDRHRKVPAYLGLRAGLICSFDEAKPRFVRDARKRKRNADGTIEVAEHDPAFGGALVAYFLRPVRDSHEPSGWGHALHVLSACVGTVPVPDPFFPTASNSGVIETGNEQWRQCRHFTSSWSNPFTGVHLPAHWT